MQTMKSPKPTSLLLAAATLLLLPSCNRGIGCPTNLSLNDLVSSLLTLLF